MDRKKKQSLVSVRLSVSLRLISASLPRLFGLAAISGRNQPPAVLSAVSMALSSARFRCHTGQETAHSTRM